MYDGYMTARSKDYARKRQARRRAKTTARGHRVGLTGAALERAIDTWAAKFPERVH